MTQMVRMILAGARAVGRAESRRSGE